MRAYFLIVAQVCLFLSATSASANSSVNWLPNMIHYMNESSVSNNPLLQSPLRSTDGKFSISWAKLDLAEYHLEYKNANDNNWQTLYRGPSTYMVPEQAFTTGIYSFRMDCSSDARCPADGYLRSDTVVLIPPDYVSSRYDETDDMVDIYWKDESFAQGYVLEHSLDNGQNWQVILPSSNSVPHQSDDFSGDLHGDASTQLSGVTTSAKQLTIASKPLRLAGNSAQSAYEMMFRVKTCVESACSEFKTSKALKIGDLQPILPDPGFETGLTEFFVSEGGGSGGLSNQHSITGEHSYLTRLKNWGYLEHIHWLSPAKGLSGLSLTGDLLLQSISPENKLSIYAVAYYQDDDTRIEGTRYELSSEDVGKSHKLYSTLYLDSSRAIKFVRYYVRLIGNGDAEFLLDNAQLYEGTSLGQDYPVLTSYLSSYSGENAISWTPFLPAGSRYHVEYKNSQSDTWTTFYKGSALSFRNPENDTNNNPDNFASALDSGTYEFRINCSLVGAKDCPNGYAYSSLVVAREPAWINTNYNAGNNLLGVAWAETVAAYGYLVEEKANNGNWTQLTPGPNDNSRVHNGETLFVDNYILLSGRTSGQYQYRVKACRSSGCTGLWRESDVLNIDAQNAALDFNVPISEYDGLLNTSWSAFKPGGQIYHVEYQLEGGSWQTWYQGAQTSFSNATPLAPGDYQFRLNCQGYGNCPQSGYVYAFSLVVTQPLYLNATYDAASKKVLLDWPKTVAAYGYVLEHSVNDGPWYEIHPGRGEPSLAFKGHVLFTATSTDMYVTQSGIHRYRIKACRSSLCSLNYTQAWLSLNAQASLAWQNQPATIGEQVVLAWDKVLIDSCTSLDTPAITLSDNNQGQKVARHLRTYDNEDTLWQCMGTSGQNLGEFRVPLTVEKLPAPANLGRVEQ